MALVEGIEVRIHQDLTASLVGLEETPQQMLKRLFSFTFRVLDDHPLLRRLTQPAEIEHLMRKLGPERLAQNQQLDEVFFEGLLAGWREQGLALEVGGSELAAMARACFAMVINRELIGEDDYDRVCDRLADGLSRSLLFSEGEDA